LIIQCKRSRCDIH